MKHYFLLMVIMGLTLAACGGGGSNTISLEFEGNNDLRFIPESASISTDSEVELTMTNVSSIDHTWTLVADTVDPARVSEEDAIAGISTGVVKGGDSETIFFAAPAVGSYKFVCTVPGHAAAGMVGDFSVGQ